MRSKAPSTLRSAGAVQDVARAPLLVLLCVLLAMLGTGCQRSDTGTADGTTGQPQLTIGVSFETLQTEAWVAGFDRIKSECARQNIKMLEAIADNDANRQFEQVRNFINRKVDGIIIVPKDGKTIIAMIKAANAANIPMVLYNRSCDPTDAKHIVVTADNLTLTRQTVQYLIEQARKTGKKHKAMILLGDLGDINAIGRRDGFEEAVKAAPEVIEVVSRIPTEWNQEKALAGVVNAFQANPDISFIFTSSDFMFPSITSALKNLGKWKKVGEEGHVILGGFDGDATAYQLLVDGYLDATGVQDFYFESDAAVKAIVDLKAGREVPAKIPDPGFVIHQGNLKELTPRMWGANVKR
jgi:ABC-type sugar transport system substrate-binding protein